jgi:PAS domain S-box-containing protein
MDDESNLVGDGDELRRRAEVTAGQDEGQVPEDLSALTPEEGHRMLHELRVHQIELEMQNDELRRAQTELDASRARYFDLYDVAPVGYCTISEKGMIQESNLTAATLLNVPRGGLVQRPIFRFILAADQDIYYRHRKRLFATREPQAFELRMVRADAGPIWVRLDATIAQDASGAPVCRVVMSDLSARKKAEDEREKLQEQLSQAQKMESVGRLAGGVAHDFNNMLSVIIGNTELALKKVDPGDPLHDTLHEIDNAARHSAEVTRQLLTFARKQIIAPRVLCLNETVEGMLKMLRRLIGEDVDLAWLPEGRLWKVKVDPAQLDQILANLCVNARDAIGGVGKITIETDNVVLDELYCADHAGARPGEFVVLSVIDNGCGMDGQTLNNMFEPFFTTKDVDKGTGLGLATIYGIVEQNGGFIAVYSEIEKGTTFKIYLPRHVESVLPIGSGTDALAPAVPGSETILLVEDEPAILRVSLMMLEHFGYTVLTASTPGEAIRLAEFYPGRIDLLLTDVIMPEMNGRDLAKKLRARDPRLKHLFMSGYSANVIADWGVLDASVHFLQKPFSMNELGSKVRQALGSVA